MFPMATVSMDTKQHHSLTGEEPQEAKPLQPPLRRGAHDPPIVSPVALWTS